MSKLQFIYGNSGSGKSEYIYQQIIEMSNREPLRNFFVVVPDQFTLQTQKEFVHRSDKGVILNIDVVSFERLAYRVFDELGLHHTVMEETGKNLVLRRIAAEHEGDFFVLRQNIRRMGYVGEIKSVLSELMQYDISPGNLEDFIHSLTEADPLRKKLEDILLLYKEFMDYLSEGYVTAEQVLDLLCSCTDRSMLLRNAVFVFDGYTGFTPIQMKFVRELMRVSGNIYVTVTMDAKEDLISHAKMHELFYMSHKMVNQLLEAAKETQCEPEEPVCIPVSEHSRLSASPMLNHLEQSLFRVPSPIYSGQELQGISLHSFVSEQDELKFAVANIQKLVREQGYRYRDFAIVSGDVESYGHYAAPVFDAVHIPFFLDTKRDILYHPLVELIRGILEIAENDYSLTGVFRYLKSGLAGFTPDEIDLLENYCIAKGIRGSSRYSKAFLKAMRNHGRIKEEEEELQIQLQQINALRARLWNQTRDLYETFHRKKGEEASVAQMTMALYDHVRALDMENMLSKMADKLEAEGKNVLAGEYRQIYRIIVDLMDKMVDLLGEEGLSIEDYTDVLEAGLSAAKVGSLPPGADCVILGDIERTRLDDIKVLFFLGVNDGIVPKSSNRHGLLSQYDREIMENGKLTLTPNDREAAFLQRFYLYLNLTKASDSLYVTYHRMNADGKAGNASYLIHVLETMFPQIAVEEHSEDSLPEITTPKGTVDAFLKGFLQAKNGTMTEDWKALYHWYSSREDWTDMVTSMEEAAFREAYTDPIRRKTAEMIYGSRLVNSVTRIELFAKCAFAHFLTYGLALGEREESSFSAPDMGTMFHEILQNYCLELEENTDWNHVTPDQQKTFLDHAMEKAVLTLPNEYLVQNARNAYMLDRIRMIMESSIRTVTEQIRRGDYRPTDYEMQFFTDGETLSLTGRVDRVDAYEKDGRIYVRIVDYKSGSKDIDLNDLYYGKQLQLVLYMTQAIEKMKKEHPGQEVLPGGMFYQWLDNPVVKEKQQDEDELSEELLAAMKLKGLVNVAEEAYLAMDRDLGPGMTSPVIPVALKKDGQPNAGSTSGATTQGFALLSRYVDAYITQTAQEILGGNIARMPYRRDKKNGCDYCDYKSICGFDTRIPGFSYREESTIQKQDVWEKMSEKLEEES